MSLLLILGPWILAGGFFWALCVAPFSVERLRVLPGRGDAENAGKRAQRRRR